MIQIQISEFRGHNGIPGTRNFGDTNSGDTIPSCKVTSWALRGRHGPPRPPGRPRRSASRGSRRAICRPRRRMRSRATSAPAGRAAARPSSGRWRHSPAGRSSGASQGGSQRQRRNRYCVPGYGVPGYVLAMHGTGPGQGRPVQTIGPDVPSTMFRVNRQDYLVVDSGDRSRLPDLSSQGIIVCETDARPN
jgi:hypothetical protein